MKTCICGHSTWDHHLSHPDKIPYCNGCVRDHKPYDSYWHEFKLDNLKLIEDIAKERNLV